jgi:hypothetical protein
MCLLLGLYITAEHECRAHGLAGQQVTELQRERGGCAGVKGRRRGPENLGR